MDHKQTWSLLICKKIKIQIFFTAKEAFFRMRMRIDFKDKGDPLPFGLHSEKKEKKKKRRLIGFGIRNKKGKKKKHITCWCEMNLYTI